MSRNSSRLALHTCFGTATIGILTTVVLSGCKGADVASAVPSGTASAPSLPPSSPDPETKAVEDAYTKLVALLDRADKLPPDVRKQQVSTYASDPQLTRILQRAGELRSKNLTAYGTTIAHVTSVQINNPDAVLWDCQDASNIGLMNARTTKKINRGRKYESTKAYLHKTNGVWKVTKLVSLGNGCKR